MKRGSRHPIRLAAALLASVLLTLSACATAPDGGGADPEAAEANDPMESVNRGIFVFNRGIDTMVVKPAATFYRDVLPPPVQEGVNNFLNNLRSPIILIHDVLQGEMERAGETLSRFFINSTVGVLGFGDPASDWGIPYHDEDFGQTLAAWGLGEGPYLMLPLLGPSNPRDTVGTVVDFLVDPITLLASNTGNEEAAWARTGTAVVDRRAAKMQALDDLEAVSIDYYSALRSAYRQNRDWEIANGRTEALPPGPSPDLDLSDLGTDAPAETVPAEAPDKSGTRRETLVPLGTFADYGAALARWETMLAGHGDLLAGADPVFQESVAGSTTRIRLLAALPVERADALMARDLESRPAVPARPVVIAEKREAPAPEPTDSPAVAYRIEIPAAAEPPAPPATEIHLASFADAKTAEAAWGVLSERYGDTLGNADVKLTEVSVGSRSYVRLLAVLPMAGTNGHLCDRLSADAAFCRVVAD